MVPKAVSAARVALAILSVALLGATATLRPPIQAGDVVRVGGAAGATARLSGTLEGGAARFGARILNRDDLRTADVHLRFSYSIPPDTIALDEIIDRIVVETRSLDGQRFGRVVIDPNDINLNPDGPDLVYRLTLYRPEGDYRARVRVFGNYE